MNKSTSESFKNTIQSEKYRSRSKLSKTLPPPELLKTAIENAQFYSKIAPSPELLKIWNSAMDLHKSLDIAQLNTINKQIASLSKADFKKIKNTVCENRSQIYCAAKANIITVSSCSGTSAGTVSSCSGTSAGTAFSCSGTNVGTASSCSGTNVGTAPFSTFVQSNQDNNDEIIIMSEQVAELVNTIDNSVEFSQSDSDKQIHVKKSDTNYFNIIAVLIALAQFFYSIYQSNASTELSKQNHAELIQEEHQQTQELKQQTQEELKQTREMQKQTREEQKQTKILEKMLNSNDASVSLSTPSTPHKD